MVNLIHRTCIIVSALTLAGPVLAQTDTFNYIKCDTREETRKATLAQYMPMLEWGPWHLIGPFDFTGWTQHNVICPPEVGIDLDATYRGKGGREVRWQQIDHTDWLAVDLRRFGTDEANYNSLAYLYREVTSDQAGELTMQMGSDDGLKFWFNGKLLVDADAQRGLNATDHTVTLPLKQGRNTVLAKITNGAANWEFVMQPVVDSRILARLEYQLNIDFPTNPEDRHYRLLTILEPREIVLEVGGLDVMDDGRPIVTTRRGDAWIVEGAYDDPPFDATFKHFAFGLHEPLGARWHDHSLLVAQRGELTRLVDLNGDDVADLYQTISDDWGVSGNYHEFAFGPKFDGEGRMWVTLNVGFCGSLGKSIVPWRGWAVIINTDGSLTPVCGGLRSPNGLGRNAQGEMFYTDNQGDWVGTNKLSHLAPGDWHGHPAGDAWYQTAGFPPPNGEQSFKPPAVWFPYDRLGRSASDILWDDTKGKFGPFEDQLFVGDQYSAIVMRVFLEQVDGIWQGACFPFRSGLDCGVNRLAFGPDGSMFIGMTNRGWWSMGRRPWGLQRLVYTGLVPFEIQEIRAMPNGFTISFTQAIDAESAAEVSSYAASSFTHHRWEKYGSPEIDRLDLPIRSVAVAADRKSVQLVVDNLRPTYVHELRCPGIRAASGGEKLLHDVAWYTLNVVPAVDATE